MPMGQNNVGVVAYTLTPRGYQEVNLADGLVHTLTLAPTLPGTLIVVLSANGGAFRYRDDGVAPTAATGFKVADGGVFSIQPENAGAIQLIADGGDTGKVDVLLYSYANSGEA